MTFSANGTNAAKNTTATFTRAGTYSFVVTIRDAGGQTAQSSVTVTVDQTLTSVTVSPASATVAAGGTQQFAATARDQFGQPLAGQPAFTWSIDAGGVGTVSATGLYQAPAAGSGTATVRATAGSLSGTAAVTVTPVVAGTGNGLAAVYFNNATSPGTSIVRTDATVNFNFGSGSPDPFIAADTFSARWIGAIEPRFSETYTFITTSDDGVRLWVNNQLIIDQWNDHTATAAHRHDRPGGRAALRHPPGVLREHRPGGDPAGVAERQPGAARSCRRASSTAAAPIQVNFQPAGAPVPAGYLADTGAAFGDRGNGFTYGWNGNNAATARDRNAANSPDQRYDTLLHLQKPELPNAVLGDRRPERHLPRPRRLRRPEPHRQRLPDQRRGRAGRQRHADHQPALDRGLASTSSSSDGRLTVTNGSGASNNKINFIDIIPLGTPPGRRASPRHPLSIRVGR